ncbi:zinc finger protein OZF-like protein [Leptotrombidium deliense]|uniref:Zinc finger protein OZF-like protein n=1 Tax=Leptotrombidium deliense TaxID=299467 RepID=A0A443S8K0_9ACAR|nr:zinc finger protein OZF-like protein [Leptotrombidium deliense]
MAEAVNKLCPPNLIIQMRCKKDDGTNGVVDINFLQFEEYWRKMQIDAMRGVNNELMNTSFSEDSFIEDDEELQEASISNNEADDEESNNCEQNVELKSSEHLPSSPSAPVNEPDGEQAVNMSANEPTINDGSSNMVIDNENTTIESNSQENGKHNSAVGVGTEQINNGIDLRMGSAKPTLSPQLRRSERISNLSATEEELEEGIEGDEGEDEEGDENLITVDYSKSASVEDINNQIIRGFLNKTPVFFCKICNMASQQKGDAQKHIRHVHLKERPYTCNECHKHFSTKTVIMKHLMTHKCEVVLYKCADCDRILKSKAALKAHTSIVHEMNNPKSMHKCLECDKLFKTKGSLTLHSMYLHKSGSPADHKCLECNKICKTKASLALHHIYMHKKKNNGQAMNQADSSALFKCELCNREFKTNASLSLHTSYVHQKNSAICLRCQQSFPDRDALRAHINQAHLNVKKFKCETCQRTFKELCNLRRHETVHKKLHQEVAQNDAAEVNTTYVEF